MHTENISSPLSPIQYLGNEHGNRIFVKREDMIPVSFGGNKARKAQLFFEQIDAGGYDSVVTYGSSSSNHCRVVCNMAIGRGLKSYIISPEEASEPTFNSQMLELFEAEVTTVPVEQVSKTIDRVLEELKQSGKKPFFIAGGGHGNPGTQAFVECYREITRYEKENDIFFDYIFHASGTGTTQAGLVCGQLMKGDDRKIVGISIARKKPRGRDVILESIFDYFREKSFSVDRSAVEAATIFEDAYIGDGYGDLNAVQTIEYVLKKYGMPLDGTYTGKAFMGMQHYLSNVIGKNVLFIHTGGTPLFFDYLKKRL